MSDAETTALQAALAAEHAAIYGYGVAGARLTGAEQQRAQKAYDAHRARRDQVAALIQGRGEDPAAAAPAYELPFAVGGAAAARRLMVRVEEGVAAAYADLVRAGAGDMRELAARVLQEVAVRAGLWREGSVPFPGLLERPPTRPAPAPISS